MMEESRCEDPHHHGGMYILVHDPPTLPEKGWEGGNVLGGHATGDRTPLKNAAPIDMQIVEARTPIGTTKMPGIILTQTPGISNKMRSLEIEEEKRMSVFT